MRKPRDYATELKALDDKTRLLKSRRVEQLGELVVACGGDALPIEQLAGVLLNAIETKDATVQEGWRVRGAEFFQRRTRTRPQDADRDASGTAAGDGGAASV